MVEAEEVGILGVLVLDDDGEVSKRFREVRRELVEGGADVVLEGRHVSARQRMTSAIRAFCVWRRFSACSQARQRGP